MLESLQGALYKDAELLSETESQEIIAASQALQQAVSGDDPVAIETAIKALDAQTQDFAARRMDAATSRTLAGHSVDEV